MRGTTRSLSLAVAVLLVGSLAMSQQQEPERHALRHYNLGEDEVALGGYDPVAYFPEGGGEPLKGNERITATHRGVAYRFASEENKKVFVANPARFEPAYGGWCAWAMADGEGDKVDVDPASFLIEEGRLLVFYDGFLANTRKKWLRKGGEQCHPTADQNWSRISSEVPRRELIHFDLDFGVAIDGYDPVAYFSDSPRAIRGSALKSYTHDGVTYRFATEANKQAFLIDPERYEPRYGGWCAHAMSKGKKVEINPAAFLVRDDRLVLFETKSLRDDWSATPEVFEKAADSSWAALLRR